MRKLGVGWILGGGDNPLRRRVDRIEAAVVVSLMVLFVITAPMLAVFAAHLTDAAGLREVRAESTWQRVQATVLKSTSYEQAGMGGGWSTTLVDARWQAPDGGRTSTGLLEVSQGARAGAHMTIWVTKNGRLAGPPLSRANVAERMAFAAVAAVFGLAAVVSMVFTALRLAANRRRMTDWTREWAATSPRWSQFR
jgi:hypothetical protein